MNPKQTGIEIRVVGNGYVVTPPRNMSCEPYDSTKVFETFDNLIAYLKDALPQHPERAR